MARARTLVISLLTALARWRAAPFAVAVVAVAAAAVAAWRLEPSADISELVARGSPMWQETRLAARTFGDDAIVVSVRGSLQRTLLTSDLARVLRLEGCLGGRVPERALRELPRVCSEIARLRPARIVYGPATFLNTAAIRISDELGRRSEEALRAARRAAAAARERAAQDGLGPAAQEQAAQDAERAELARFTNQVLQLSLRYGLAGSPSLADPDFVAAVVFDPTRPAGTPKARFSYLFPARDLALIQMRLRPDLSTRDRSRAVALVRRAVRERLFQPRYGARYAVTGVPAIVDDLAGSLTAALARLLAVAVVVMAFVLVLLQRGRRRLVPLATALAATAVTFALLALVGGELTLAALAVLPVLVGLAVDYAVQVRARLVEEAQVERLDEAAALVTQRIAPALVTAAAATVAGFFVLLLSPLPVVRTFGALLIVGTVAALAVACAALPRALVPRSEPERDRAGGDTPPTRRSSARTRRSGLVARARDVPWRLFDTALARPQRVLRLATAVAGVGLVLGLFVPVSTDLARLLPRNLASVEAALAVQRASGLAGQLDVLVHAPDVTDPRLLRWMARVRSDVLRSGGWREGRRCGTERGNSPLCPGPSYSELVGATGARTREQVRALLAQVPAYLLQGVVDRRRGLAVMSFGVAAVPLAEQHDLVEMVRSKLDPPAGIRAEVTGTLALSADAAGRLASPVGRLWSLLAALAAAALVLAVTTRRSVGTRFDHLLPLLPVALAAGWSGAVAFVFHVLPAPLGVELNPLSAMLAVLTVAITTEFAVLLWRRYREERAGGSTVERALTVAYASTGRAVWVSAATTLAGFLVLATSDIAMLRSFGILTALDLALAFVGVVLVLPAAIVAAEARAERQRTVTAGAPAAQPAGQVRGSA
ncbi:MMPL family transporter [Thermoleophilum album]|jgi:predicted RND superfamily exporter protein|uniref:MMPL family transporter n=1 Tax=Thermoleophilum album TaxID=29539 RepID=UPI00237CE630|nr:MMPL family transporter [Thermoleophilum album]WDT93354.1 MMPL family transporter [Thermoleophilum album]